jgi:4-carboxymuconolactone decarboxylase
LVVNESQYERGLKIRRQVLGDEHVTRSLAAATEFARPLQDMVTENCWGGIWSRAGLTLRERSLLNIAMLSSMGRLNELKVHTRGALNNGCTREDLQEVILQVATYCGLPAALDATRSVEAVLAEHVAS